MTQNHQHFSELVLNIEHTQLSQMFGKLCGKIHKKAFVAFYQDEMVFKLGAEEVNRLKGKYEGAQNWDPSGKGRAMKDWLQLSDRSAADWESLAEAACGFVGQVNN